MTVKELMWKAEAILKAGGCETPAFDSMCLLEDIGGVGRGKVDSSLQTNLSEESCKRVLTAARCRAAGEPLQYLLGTWDFLNLTLEVGKGVLIPRPETELLCELAAERLPKGRKTSVLDLCAGTGCVGLGIASLCPTATVTALELSKTAFGYLQRNIARYPALSVRAVHADVLTEAHRFTESVDAVVSNPPYIPDADMGSLQREVQHEPSMALAAGDGYRFYRIIAQQWIRKIKTNGFVAVEVGIGQSEMVEELFKQAGLQKVHSFKDFSGIPRVVCGEKQQKYE